MKWEFFFRINSNERVLEERIGSANAVEDESGIGKSGEGEGEGEGDEKVVLLEAFTDDVGVKLLEVERGWIWIEGGSGGGGGFGKATAIATDSGERERVSTSMDKGH